MAEAINLVKIVRKCEAWILVVEVSDDFVNCRRDFEEERMTDESSETVKRELIEGLTLLVCKNLDNIEETYCILHEFVQGIALNFVGVVKVFNCDELLKSSLGEFGLFNKFVFSAHSVSSGCCQRKGSGRSVHSKFTREKMWGGKSVKSTDFPIKPFDG
jgi:hypothetical protein